MSIYFSPSTGKYYDDSGNEVAKPPRAAVAAAEPLLKKVGEGFRTAYGAADPYYQRYVAQPLSSMVSGVIRAPFTVPSAETPIGGSKESLLPEPLVQGLTHAIVPQDLGTAGLAAATFGLGPETRLGKTALRRIATMGGLGGGKAYVARENVPEGVVSGAAAQGIGEVGTRVGQRLIQGALAERETGRLGTFLSKQFPWFGKLQTGPDFEAAFVGPNATAERESLSRLQQVKATIARALRGQMSGVRFNAQGQAIRSYTPKQFTGPIYDELANFVSDARIRKVSNKGRGFGDIDDLITRANTMAFGKGRDLKDQQFARDAGEIAREALDQLTKDLNAAEPGSGTAYRQARQEYHLTRTMKYLFEEPGVIEGNVIQMPKLRQIARSVPRGMRSDLEESMGKGGFNAFAAQVWPGASPAMTDVPRRGLPRVYGHIPGVPLSAHIAGGGKATKFPTNPRWSPAPLSAAVKNWWEAP